MINDWPKKNIIDWVKGFLPSCKQIVPILLVKAKTLALDTFFLLIISISWRDDIARGIVDGEVSSDNDINEE